MIKDTNYLHKKFCYTELGDRIFPKRGIIPFSTVKAAAKWLRHNKKQKEDENKN